ncbi:MAG: hypothetical protein ACMUIP_11140 [bacterium]
MQPRLCFNNFQIKVQVLFLFVVLVPLCIVAFFIRTAQELIVNMPSNQLENVTDNKVALLERWISERNADLRAVASSSIQINGCSSDCPLSEARWGKLSGL